MIRLDSNWALNRILNPNEWILVEIDNNTYGSVTVHERTIDYLITRGHNSLSARLVQGKNLLVEIDYGGDLIFEEPTKDNRQTYPASNVIFDPKNIVRQDGPVYVFQTNYGSHHSRMELPSHSLDFFYANLPDELRNNIKVVEGCQAVADNMSMMHRTLDGLVGELHEFVSESGGEPEREDFKTLRFKNYWSMEHILQEYYETGKFSGDCKSFGTFTAGLANALGIPARLVGGFLLMEEESLENPPCGHFWPELYIPTNRDKGFWAPIDPANPALETVLAFPDPPALYFASGVMPQFSGPKEAKIKISYV